MSGFSIAIPTYNRYDLVRACIGEIIHDPRVDEIVIVDDYSTDGSYERLLTFQESFKIPKIKVYRNAKNLDCYANKARAVALSSSPWIVLFDSDNVLTPSYLDALYVEEPWDERTVYLPTFAQPHFDYREFEGLRVTKNTVGQYAGNQTFLTALNTANYLVPRVGYIDVWDPHENPHTADSIYMAYRFLLNGFTLAFVKNLHYLHRVHEQSHYKNNVHKTGDFARRVEDALRSMK